MKLRTLLEITKNNAKYLKLIEMDLAVIKTVIKTKNLDKFVKDIKLSNIESLEMCLDFDKDWINQESNGLGTPVVVVSWKDNPKNAYRNKIKSIVRKYLSNGSAIKEEGYTGDGVDESYFILSTKIEGIERHAADDGGLRRIRPSLKRPSKDGKSHAEHIKEIVLKDGTKYFQPKNEDYAPVWCDFHYGNNLQVYVQEKDDFVKIPIEKIEKIIDDKGKDISQKFKLDIPDNDTSGKVYDIEKSKKKKYFNY